MIRINLLPQRRAKKKRAGGVAMPSAGDTGARDMALGIAAIVAAGVLVFFVFDKPKRDKVNENKETAKQLEDDINTKAKELAGNDKVPPYAVLKAASESADQRAQEIDHLNASKIVPAHVLHELGEVLGLGRKPAMIHEWVAATAPSGDPNKQFQTDWDPQHVWLSSFADSAGTFKIEGGAQTEGDVAQFAKRLQASVYFMEVAPSVGQPVVDKDTGLAYYKFTITGRLAY